MQGPQWGGEYTVAFDGQLARLRGLLVADLRRPWGPWAILCVIGCAASLGFVAMWAIAPRSTVGGWLPFVAACVLPASVALGVVALTREGTCKAVPYLILTLACGFGWPLILMGLLDVPYLVLDKLSEYPSLAGIPLIVVGTILLIRRIRGRQGPSR